MSYGPHLTMDLAECEQNLDRVDGVVYLLDELPRMLNMKPLMPPYAFWHSSCSEEDRGITGVVVIAESHISCHTYPEKNFVFLDIFSCKPFDRRAAMDYVIEHFKSKNVEQKTIERGKHFPQTVGVTNERNK